MQKNLPPDEQEYAVDARIQKTQVRHFSLFFKILPSCTGIFPSQTDLFHLLFLFFSTPTCHVSLWRQWHNIMKPKCPSERRAKAGFRDSWRSV